MKQFQLLFLLLIISMTTFAQNLSLSDLLAIKKKDLGNAEEFLTSKGWEFYEATEPTDYTLGKAIFSYERDRDTYDKDKAQSFIRFYYSKYSSKTRIELKTSNVIKYNEYINAIKGYGCKLISSKIKDGSIEKVYRGATTTFEIISSIETKSKISFWFFLIVSNDDYDQNFTQKEVEKESQIEEVEYEVVTEAVTEELETSPVIERSFFTDPRDGYQYQVVTIGKQDWMAENLRATKYSNGIPIPLVTGTRNWNALTATSKAYCWYNDDIANKATYGALYTWSAAMNGAASTTNNPSRIQGVCPTGWHLPSNAEWIQLSTYLGGESVANGKLKEIGTSHWNSPNTDATNETGFTALPGGYRTNNGTFINIGSYGYWWGATESSATGAWNIYMGYNYSNVSSFYTNKKVGFSVRCVRD